MSVWEWRSERLHLQSTNGKGVSECNTELRTWSRSYCAPTAREQRGRGKVKQVKGNQPRTWNPTVESFQKAGWSPVPNNTERFKIKEVKTTQKRSYLCLGVPTTFRCRLQLQILHCHGSQMWASFSVHACSVAPTLCDPMDCSLPTRLLLSMELSRQEYWSGLPFLAPNVFQKCQRSITILQEPSFSRVIRPQRTAVGGNIQEVAYWEWPFRYTIKFGSSLLFAELVTFSNPFSPLEHGSRSPATIASAAFPLFMNSKNLNNLSLAKLETH